MNKFTCTLTLLSLLTCAIQSHAQASNFEGLSVGAIAEANRGTFRYGLGLKGSDHNTGTGIKIHYNWSADEFLLSVGLTSAPGIRGVGNYANGLSANSRDRYSLDLMPGYALGPKLLMFGKFSAVSAKSIADDGASKSALVGANYGLGLRGLFDDRHKYWELGFDTTRFNGIKFSTGTFSTLRNDLLSIGAGYKF